MKTIEVKGSVRKEVGKRATNELRKEDKVPCVLYGGEGNVHFSTVAKDLRHLLITPNVYIVNLDVDGKKVQAIMQDADFHPVTDEVLHVDFLQLSDDKETTIAIPVKLTGLAIGVKEGGKLILNQRKLKVRGFAKNLPDTLDVDVTELTIGRTKKVSELSFDNLELLDPKNSVVAAVRLTRSAMSAKGAEGDEAQDAPAEAAAE